jgi:S-adenosylmethionine:tRNA ribosyltransferase-isomerase
MNINLYNYELPKELIAKYPLARGEERLLVAERSSGRISHLTFRDIPSFLQKGDLLVLNNTRVIPARIMGRKETGGKVEILLVKKIDDKSWQCLLKASKKIRNGAR